MSELLSNERLESLRQSYPGGSIGSPEDGLISTLLNHITTQEKLLEECQSVLESIQSVVHNDIDFNNIGSVLTKLQERKK